MDVFAPPDGSGSIPDIDREPFELFLSHQARFLDDQRFEDWMALFTENGLYWVPTSPNQADPYRRASLFFDDRESMKTRIERLRHPLILVQMPPSRNNHLFGNVIVEEATPDGYLAGSSIRMAEYRLDAQCVLAGHQFHRLREDGRGFSIALKRVHLVNCDSAFEAMAVSI